MALIGDGMLVSIEAQLHEKNHKSPTQLLLDLPLLRGIFLRLESYRLPRRPMVCECSLRHNDHLHICHIANRHSDYCRPIVILHNVLSSDHARHQSSHHG